MSDTKKTLVSDNTPNLEGLDAPKVIKRFPTSSPAAEATSALAESAGVENSAENKEEGSGEPLDEKAKERQERRAAFKRAADIEARAMQMQKQAEEKLKKAQQWEQISQKFQEDPTSVAEAFGLSREEFLRKYQNHVFSIKDEPEDTTPKDPVEEMKKRMESLEEERKREKEEQQTLQYQFTKSNYINSNIMPALADKDKYKFLHKNGIDETASYIYELMNSHYQQTGEELSINDVAEIANNKLKEAFFAKMNQVKEMGLLDEYMGTAEKKEEKAPAQLGGTSKQPSRTLSDSWAGSSSPAPVQKQRQSFLSREERLAKTAAALEALGKGN